MQDSTTVPQISVLTPFTQALDRVKLVLFQPFQLGKWFVIGFAAWLAHLGEGGGSFNFNPGSSSGKSEDPDFRQMLENGKAWTMDNLDWLIPVGVVVLLIALALGVLCLWLSSRGKFMFLHCVARNVAQVKEPWHRYAVQGNSLFWLRLLLGFTGLVLVLPVVALGVFAGIATFGAVGANAGAVIGFIAAILLLIVIVVALLVVSKLVLDFLVPIMYLRSCTCREAWPILRAQIRPHIKEIALYFLFQVVLAMGIGTVVMVFMLCTCCFCGLMLFPYISTVILLPVLVFDRAYSAHYLAQFGPQFDVFEQTELPAA